MKVVFILFSLQMKCILSQLNGHALFIQEADQHAVHSPHFPSPRLPGSKKTGLNLALAHPAVCLLLRAAASSAQNKPNPGVFWGSDDHAAAGRLLSLGLLVRFPSGNGALVPRVGLAQSDK